MPVRHPLSPLSEFLSSPSLFSANQLLVKRTELEARVDLSNNPSEAQIQISRPSSKATSWEAVGFVSREALAAPVIGKCLFWKHFEGCSKNTAGQWPEGIAPELPTVTDGGLLPPRKFSYSHLRCGIVYTVIIGVTLSDS